MSFLRFPLVNGNRLCYTYAELHQQMRKKEMIVNTKRLLTLALCAALLSGLLAGCGSKSTRLDPKEPVNLTVWHYYNGAQLSAFSDIVDAFNSTVGQEKGIYVSSYSKGSVNDLESAVRDSLEGKVGAEPMPDLFSSYSDTAFNAEQAGALANLSDYFTQEELDDYIPSYVKEGCIAADGSLRIFPIAKSTEIMILNKTDWEPFAEDTGVTLDQLATIEGVVEVSKKYYQWTDEQTPDIPGDGKAFYGRDALPNYFFVGAQQLGQPLLKVENDQAHVNADQEVFRKLWDNYYVPMVSGWFGAYGRFRSDDVKTGCLLAYTGSTASARYFPKQVETETGSYPIDYEVLPVPIFAGGKNVIVQQGAGMAVTKSDAKREAAAVEFLRWFTQAENNVRFGAGSGYLPVLKEANRAETFREIAENQHLETDPITDSCITLSLERMEQAEFLTPRPSRAAAPCAVCWRTAWQTKSPPTLPIFSRRRLPVPAGRRCWRSTPPTPPLKAGTIALSLRLKTPRKIEDYE